MYEYQAEYWTYCTVFLYFLRLDSIRCYYVSAGRSTASASQPLSLPSHHKFDPIPDEALTTSPQSKGTISHPLLDGSSSGNPSAETSYSFSYHCILKSAEVFFNHPQNGRRNIHCPVRNCPLRLLSYRPLQEYLQASEIM